jgi:iron complex transport system permease protein
MIGSRHWLLPFLLLSIVLVVGCIVWSITLGAADISPQVVYDAIFHTDESNFQHLIIQMVRLPRVLSGVIVGASLAVAGALMQGLTRNPLADAGILGIESGASFAVVMAVAFISALSFSSYAIFAFIGGGITAIIVYALGSMGRGGATPLKLTLAGVIVTAFISSFTTIILIMNQTALERIRFWLAGSLAGRETPLLLQTAPYMIIGLIGSMFISRQITTISLGEDVAAGLGQNTLWIKAIAAVLVVLLAGGAVALAGPIGFVGLVVPHMIRFVVGSDYRWVIPYSAVFGAILVTLADIGARIVIKPQELPVGVIMALLGGPFFIWLARWKVRR